MKLSVLMPVYNEELGVAEIIRKVAAVPMEIIDSERYVALGVTELVSTISGTYLVCRMKVSNTDYLAQSQHIESALLITWQQERTLC